MKFSIIIPTYKGSDTLGIAIQSILNQSYSDYEIIVSDDNVLNSPEQIETKNLLNKFQKNNSNIIYLVNDHHNGSYARNKGIEASKGEYIAFLDDDDLYLDTCLEKTAHYFEKYPNINMVFHDVLVVNKNSSFKHVTNANLNSFSLLCGTAEIGTGSNIFIRKSGFESLHFDDSYIRHQDIEFVSKLLNKSSYYWNNEIQILKYFNKSNNYPNKDLYLEMQKKLRDDMLKNSVISESEYKVLQEKHLHIIFNDLLLNRANIEDISAIKNELEAIESYKLKEKMMFTVYKLSKPLFFSIANLYLKNKYNDDNSSLYDAILKKRSDIIKQIRSL